MPLAPGTRLGIYDIIAPLGAGGMGEVYRARDPKLNREVALKVVSDAFAGDSELLARFQREARTLAALNHPHIAQIYGFDDSSEVHALAMELVDGPTVADRISRGPLPPAEALTIATQIAEALQAAHHHGIIHRDLKPGNIKIRPDGTVKVLDFGLAKALDRTQPAWRGGSPSNAIDAANSPTVLSSGTQMGVLIGTAAYMAPEQARGRPVDQRADIWAFGCVLYEMLAGRPAFGGETLSETLASVLRDPVDWDALPASVAPAFRRVLKRCLERDPDRRFHDIADVRIELSEPYEADAAIAAPKHAATVARSLGLFAVGALVAGVVVWLTLRPQVPSNERVQRFALAGLSSLVIDPNQALTLSPDGRALVYRGRGADGVDRLFIRHLDALLPTSLAGTEGGRQPFFSPDGQWVGFFAGGFMKKVAVTGGAPQTIAAAAAPLGGFWMDDGSIVFVADVASGLLRIPSTGGKPETLLPINSEQKGPFTTPWGLPGGTAVLLSIRRDNRFDVAVFSLPDRKLHVLAEDAYSPVLASSGHVLFHQGNSILALPFDSRRLAAAGPAFPVLSNISTRISFQTRLFAVSRDGTLAYVPAAPPGESVWRMVWVDRKGEASVVTNFDRPADTPRLSPDGSQVAFRTPATNCDVWVHDLARGTTTRLTHEGDNHGVVWMNDGTRVGTARERREGIDIISVSPDGRGSIERVATFPPASNAVPSSWSSGTLLVQRGGGPTGIDITAVSADRDPKPIVSSPFEDSGGIVSSDGRFVAYVSNESGRAEVYLQSLTGEHPRVQVSTTGGVEPVWARNGKELFLRHGRDLIAVTIETTPKFSIGRPHVLFSGDYAFGPLAATISGLANYDVAPDGKRFLMMTGTQWLEGQLVVVLNWFEDWKQFGNGARP